MGKPIYNKIRWFLGHKDLVISFYTRKCFFKCIFCNLSIRSSKKYVPSKEINKQIDYVFNYYGSDLPEIYQLSCGNEGSILDGRTFSKRSLEYLITRINKYTNIRWLSLETRAEFITNHNIKWLKNNIANYGIDFAIGLETRNDYIRNEIIKKNLEIETFEYVINIMSRNDIRATVYIMVKPSPFMTENEAIEEAVISMIYLDGLRKQNNINMIVYINPTYIPWNSYFEQIALNANYEPPNIWTIVKILKRTAYLKIPTFIGLYSEGLGEEVKGCAICDLEVKRGIKRYNNSQNIKDIQGLTCGCRR